MDEQSATKEALRMEALRQSMWHKPDDPEKLAEIADIGARLGQFAEQENQKALKKEKEWEHFAEEERQRGRADFLELSLGEQLWMLYQAMRERT